MQSVVGSLDIANVTGAEAVLGSRLSSIAELVPAISEGLPKTALKRRTRIASAEYVLEGGERAQRWLVKPQLELGGQSPLQTAMTELGARQVEDLLGKIFYGLPV